MHLSRRVPCPARFLDLGKAHPYEPGFLERTLFGWIERETNRKTTISGGGGGGSTKKKGRTQMKKENWGGGGATGRKKRKENK